ncbi:Ecp5 [Fulvia fulva]|uniref:Ecp5 n=1 Tax=Passalora fulva TaxID=5499 RepID=Q9P407_PASFU|nr:Ecp5 [Fulvia fulva]ABM47073.1 extracellular protein 5 [Fulvia fulva]KAK4632307.1 Ecp5 [Fulvia fulva]KAK4632847.1 Ecp5 [Fulvia fulva]QDX18283.1 ECP5 protein [Fulvia fulva]QDX18285.1 ECP5 protein [Fulvia fulva]
MNTFTLLLATLPLLAYGRGDNKPGQFNYICEDIPCDEEGVDSWILQACIGIGGTELTAHGGIYDTTGELVGRTAICLCARGQTKAHDYNISGDYPPGVAHLTFDVRAPYWCQSSG